MPLTEASKSKVSLASLSATTAAAAESLWSKSKKSSKKRQKSASVPATTPEVSSTSVPSSNLLIRPSQSDNQIPSLQLQQSQPIVPVDRNEFRRKFLEGLQFYCENSSLILNSDLPADLIEFVTSHGFSVESLGIILELKKSSSAFSAYVDKKPVGDRDTSVLGVQASGDTQSREQNFSEISRRLLQHWMNADSCAEAFVSLSLGEEIPGLIAECASFQRILFAVPDNFHLIGEDFLSFLLAQLLLAIRALVYGIKVSSSVSADDKDVTSDNAEPTTIRTQVLAQFLDRTCMRYFSDLEHFYSSKSVGSSTNAFQEFVVELAELCSEDVIARRLVSKIFLHVGSHSALKLVKVIFSSGIARDKKVSSVLLYPSFEFLERNSQWKFILQTLPVKTATKSKGFWLNWAEYVENESKCFPEFWKKTAEHWIILNKSPLVDAHSLYSTSLAITALAKQIKVRINQETTDKETISQYLISLEPAKVLTNIVHSLESINEDKRACGMAVGQIIADLQFNMLISKHQPKTGEEPKKLKFDCKAQMFIDLVNFYETENDEYDTVPGPVQKVGSSSGSHKIEVLDSDDDEEDNPDEEQDVQIDDGFPVLGEDPEDKKPEIGIDPRILTLRARKRKIPKYFSEIVETLLEKSKNEDEAEILQYIVVMKIPVLLFMGAKIDGKMATTITRCLADLEDGTSLQVPILLAIYEMFMQHPFEVADVLAEVTFSRDHYALGQRLSNLTRLTRITELSSKQTCFSCFFGLVKKHEKELLGIYPEFIEKYLHSRMKLRFCHQCRASGLTNLDEMANSTNIISNNINDESKSLTWREIVDKRVAAKTRYFVTPRNKTAILVVDDYSSKLFPILWASIANRLTSQTAFYMDINQRQMSGNLHDLFLVKVFQFLARCIMGSSGPNCPHIRNVSSHAGELVSNFSGHPDALVRRAVLSLLGVTLSVGEGKVFVVEALSSQRNILETVDQLTNAEEDSENRKFLGQIQQCLAAYTTAGLLKDLNLE